MVEECRVDVLCTVFGWRGFVVLVYRWSCAAVILQCLEAAVEARFVTSPPKSMSARLQRRGRKRSVAWSSVGGQSSEAAAGEEASAKAEAASGKRGRAAA